jgi:hypothetical protein
MLRVECCDDNEVEYMIVRNQLVVNGTATFKSSMHVSGDVVVGGTISGRIATGVTGVVVNCAPPLYYEGSTLSITQASISSSGYLRAADYALFAAKQAPLALGTASQFLRGDGVWTTGPVGVQGPVGERGPPGDVGARGPVGAAGPQGEVGLRGPSGPQGAQGPVGFAGAKGATGDAGPLGDAGPQGVQGITGPAGPTGPAGAQGLPGPTGPTGAPGVTGPAGAAGAQGAAGVQGPAGPAGPTGLISGVLDYAGAVQIGTSLATGITIGRVGITTNILGTLLVNGSALGGASKTFFKATLNLKVAGAVLVGTTAASGGRFFPTEIWVNPDSLTGPGFSFPVVNVGVTGGAYSDWVSGAQLQLGGAVSNQFQVIALKTIGVTRLSAAPGTNIYVNVTSAATDATTYTGTFIVAGFYA